MTGDPKVLAGLQQAYLAADDVHTTRAIESAWQHETDGWRIAAPSVEHRIRAWTPPAEPSLEQRVAEIERGYRHHDQQIGIGIDRNTDLTNRLNDEEAVNRRQWDDLESLRCLIAEQQRKHSELIDNISAGFTKVDRRIRAITHPDCICGTEDGASCPVHSHPELIAPDDPVYQSSEAQEDEMWKRHFGDEDDALPESPAFPEPAAADLDPVRVEAAAQAIRGDGWGRSWDELSQTHRDSYIRDARLAIRAYLSGETR